MRSANARSTSCSQHSSTSALPGSRARTDSIPLRISPVTSTLRYRSASSIPAYQPATRESHRGPLRTSEMMFVSMRNIGFDYENSGTRPGSAERSISMPSRGAAASRALRLWGDESPKCSRSKVRAAASRFGIAQYGGDSTYQRDVLPRNLYLAPDPSFTLQALAVAPDSLILTCWHDSVLSFTGNISG